MKNKKPEQSGFNEILLYTTPNGGVKVEIYLQNETIWLTQQKIAELFGVQRPAVTKHLKNIFESGELKEYSVSSTLEHTAADGKKYSTRFYNLDAIISVGYRVNSSQATAFRIWATERLREYIIKGFTMDDERLKNPNNIFGKDYFDEQLARIRDIRSSERRFYQKITDIYTQCSADYNVDTQSTKDFFATVQNKLHWAITGQYFTPRPLIRAMVECVQPEPMKTIADPACGTGGFFLAAYDYLVSNNKLDKDQNRFIKLKTFFGNEIVAGTRRLALMNLFLHNIGDIGSDNFISPADSLIAASSVTYDYVLANPPFGKKSSQTFTNNEGEQEKEDLTYNRQDFWATTSNKQLNFVQHIRTMLKTTGLAAVVVPDNVLFEGGAGETVRKKLMETTDLHTILRLPTGIFYAQGVKANVIFFDNKPASKDPWTKETWVYDYRTNIHHTLKKNPLKLDDLKDFIVCYNPSNRHKRKETFNTETNPEGRWRKFTYDEIIGRDKTSLDITWLKDKSLADLDNLPDPDVIAEDIIENLESGLESFREIIRSLNAK